MLIQVEKPMQVVFNIKRYFSELHNMEDIVLFEFKPFRHEYDTICK